MDRETLINGYRSVLATIYAPENYYARVRHFLRSGQRDYRHGGRIRIPELAAVFKSIVRLGVIGRERYQYWKLFFWSLLRHPRRFPDAITFAIYGFHFRKIIRNHRPGPAPEGAGLQIKETPSA